MVVQLPPEIIKLIIDDLAACTITKTPDSKINDFLKIGIRLEENNTQIHKYATVSREWQSFVEAHTFKSLKITSHELEFFHNITINRRHLVSSLHYHVLLPTYDAEACKRPENAEEQEVNSIEFTKAIEDLFDHCEDWPSRKGTDTLHRQRHLFVGCFSPSDIQWQIYERMMQRYNDPNDITERRYTDHQIKFLLDREPCLAEISAFSSLGSSWSSSREIEASTFCILAARMPQLVRFSVQLFDLDNNSETRIQRRSDFAKGLSRLPGTLREFSLRYYNETPDDQTLSPFCFQPGLQRDPLSCGIHLLSQRLISLSLEDCVIDKDLFWPSKHESGQIQPPIWPDLEKLVMKPRAVLANGTWLYEKDPNYPDDSDESNDENDDGNLDEEVWNQPKSVTFRRKPVSSEFDEFYFSAARAAGNMPKLRSLKIEFNVDFPDKIYHEFEFRDDGGKKMVSWQTSPAYQPSSEVQEAWRTAKDLDLEITVLSERPSWMPSVEF